MVHHQLVYLFLCKPSLSSSKTGVVLIQRKILLLLGDGPTEAFPARRATSAKFRLLAHELDGT